MFQIRTLATNSDISVVGWTSKRKLPSLDLILTSFSVFSDFRGAGDGEGTDHRGCRMNSAAVRSLPAVHALRKVTRPKGLRHAESAGDSRDARVASCDRRVYGDQTGGHSELC